MTDHRFVRWNIVGLILVLAVSAESQRVGRAQEAGYSSSCTGADCSGCTGCAPCCSRCDGCGSCSACLLPGILNLNVGTSYFSLDNEDLWGGNYSIDYATRIAGNLALFATAEFNHFTHGTQMHQAVGFFRAPFYHERCWHDRISFASTWHFFTDTRVVGGLSLAQYRAQLGYLVTPVFEVGTIYTTPLGREDGIPFINPVAQITGSVGTRESISLYATRSFCFGGIGLQAGYLEDPDTYFLGLVSQTQLTDDLGTYASLTYEDRETDATWSAALGFTFELGDWWHRSRKGRGHSDTCCSETPAPPVLPAPPMVGETNRSIVRGQGDGVFPDFLFGPQFRERQGVYELRDLYSQENMSNRICQLSGDQRSFVESGGGMFMTNYGAADMWRGTNFSHAVTGVFYNVLGTGAGVVGQ